MNVKDGARTMRNFMPRSIVVQENRRKKKDVKGAMKVGKLLKDMKYENSPTERYHRLA